MIERFLADDCSFLAGGVAFQLFFALIPLLALIVGALALMFGPERAQTELARLFGALVPGASAEDVRIAEEIVEGRAVSFGVGLVGTIFAAMAIHNALDTALAAVLGRDGRRPFVRGYVQAALFVAALLVLAVISFGLSYGAAIVTGALDDAGLEGAGRVGGWILAPLAGLALGVAFFYLVYWALPRRRLPRGVALEAALVSAVLWEVAKLAFGFFTRALTAFAAYGPLAFAAGLLTWIYLTAVIILIGAEVMKTRGST